MTLMHMIKEKGCLLSDRWDSAFVWPVCMEDFTRFCGKSWYYNNDSFIITSQYDIAQQGFMGGKLKLD